MVLLMSDDDVDDDNVNVLMILCWCIAVCTAEEDADADHLLGRPDGHEPFNKQLIGRPDGHDEGADDDDDFVNYGKIVMPLVMVLIHLYVLLY